MEHLQKTELPMDNEAQQVSQDEIPAKQTVWLVQNEYRVCKAYRSRAKAEAEVRRLNRMYNLAVYEVREVALYL